MIKRKRPRKLISERTRLRGEIKHLQERIAQLDADVGLRLEIRGIHTDLDSVKHMVRGIHTRVGAGVAPALYEYVEPNVQDILQKVRGEFVSAGQAPLKKRRNRK